MNRKTMVIAIGILIAFCAGIYFWAEWQKAQFDASLPEVPAPEVQAETEGGHWHGDEWHAEPHNVNFVTPIAEPPEVDFSVQPTAAPETESDAQFSATLAEILATPEYTERLRVIRSIGKHDPAYAKWAEEDLRLQAEGELLERENPLWSPDGTATREEIERNVVEENKRIANMTQEERLAAVKEIEVYGQKRDEWFERRKAHAAKMPLSQAAAEILNNRGDY